MDQLAARVARTLCVALKREPTFGLWPEAKIEIVAQDLAKIAIAKLAVCIELSNDPSSGATIANRDVIKLGCDVASRKTIADLDDAIYGDAPKPDDA